MKLVLLLILILVPLVSIDAQCPDRKPPNKDGSCRRSPIKVSPRSVRATACSIMVRVTRKGDSKPLPGVELTLTGARNKTGMTDEAGSFLFDGLDCRRNYDVATSLAGFTFDPSSAPFISLKSSESINFIAIAFEPLPSTPPPLPSPPPCNPPSTSLPEVGFGQRQSGKTYSCENLEAKAYYSEHLLKRTAGDDDVAFQLQSQQISSLTLAVIDKYGRPLELGQPSLANDLRISRIVLPDQSDYRVRVTSQEPDIEYTLLVSRLGLSEEGYQKRLRQSYDAIALENRPDFYGALNFHINELKPFNQPNSQPGSQEADRKIKAAALVLEQLISIVPTRHEPYGRLAAIYLYYKKDPVKGFEFARKSLELGGEAGFRVKYGTELKKKLKDLLSEKKVCWLRIRKGSAICERESQDEGPIFTTNTEVLKNMSLNVSDYDLALKIEALSRDKEKKDKRKKIGRASCRERV